MAEIKLTKNELRDQEKRLDQLLRYLPTLQLKKAMLQIEVQQAKEEIAAFTQQFNKKRDEIASYSALYSEQLPFEWEQATVVQKVNKEYENIAGVEVPSFKSVDFQSCLYNLGETPIWVDSAFASLRELVEKRSCIEVAEEKRAALQEELREVSIRVNLFEKILIPRSLKNIKKIKVFLGDQQLAAVSQAKVAKTKIEARKHAH